MPCRFLRGLFLCCTLYMTLWRIGIKLVYVFTLYSCERKTDNTLVSKFLLLGK